MNISNCYYILQVPNCYPVLALVEDTLMNLLEWSGVCFCHALFRVPGALPYRGSDRFSTIPKVECDVDILQFLT